jgi:hypothetical protein
VARQLGRAFRLAGLTCPTMATWASNRQAPLGNHERTFLAEYVRDLRERASPHLEPAAAERFERLVAPGSPDYLLDDPDLCMTSLDYVAIGRRAVE